MSTLQPKASLGIEGAARRGPGLHALLRSIAGFIVAVLLAPALVGSAATVVLVAASSPTPDMVADLGSAYWILPALSVIWGAFGSAVFAAPWLFAAGKLRRIAPGRAAWALAGAGAGLTYCLAAAALSVATGASPGSLGVILGLWPAVTAFETILGGGGPDVFALTWVVAPPLAGAVAGWVYALIARKG